MKVCHDMDEIANSAFAILHPVGVCTILPFLGGPGKFIISKESPEMKVRNASKREKNERWCDPVELIYFSDPVFAILLGTEVLWEPG
jgi:hypothetical protein